MIIQLIIAQDLQIFNSPPLPPDDNAIGIGNLIGILVVKRRRRQKEETDERRLHETVGVSRVAFVFSVGRARRVERVGGVARATTSAPEFTPKKGKRNEGKLCSNSS